MAKKEEMTGFSLRVNSQEYNLLAAICALDGTTISDVLRNFVSEYVAQNKGKLADALKAAEAKK